MLRNRELRRFLSYCLAVSAACLAAAFWFDWRAGLFAFLLALLLCAGFFRFTFLRYREIRRLSDYLARIRTQKKAMDIRDIREGELSILKNDIYKLTLTLSEQSELLKKDKAYLAEALANISHQLKTPLTSMIVMTDLLSSPELPGEKRQEFTACIRSQLSRIEWLLTALLKMSKLDAGAVTFKPRPVPLSALLKQAVDPLRIPMELKEQSLSLSGAEGVVLYCDPNWTAEALVNLLKNSMEHTPQGGEIQIRWLENPLHVELSVSDTGSGIEPDDLPHIFERFYKGKNASPDSVGIGLAMSKSILNRQNAGLFVQSRPGEGSCFQIKFYKQVV